MRSGGNNYSYFPKNKLTKLANFVAAYTYAYVLSGGLGVWAPCPPLGYATGYGSRTNSL